VFPKWLQIRESNPVLSVNSGVLNRSANLEHKNLGRSPIPPIKEVYTPARCRFDYHSNWKKLDSYGVVKPSVYGHERSCMITALPGLPGTVTCKGELNQVEINVILDAMRGLDLRRDFSLRDL
jgi:hypothetical protein